MMATRGCWIFGSGKFRYYRALPIAMENFGQMYDDEQQEEFSIIVSLSKKNSLNLVSLIIKVK